MQVDTRSGEALKVIRAQVDNVGAEINQIAVASEEETHATNEIASSIQQISVLMSQMSSRIQENADTSSGLANLSRELNETVGHFKL